MGCVIWIAIFVKSILDLFGYIDDNFFFEREGNVLWYEPYKCYYPAKQTKVLMLWDEIGLPHEKGKQEYGLKLRIIGFEVDPNAMTVTMARCDRLTLLENVRAFVKIAPGGTRRSLRDFQQIAGYINWALNVYPLLKPGLSNLYAKISGKSQPFAKIRINQGLINDFQWFASHVERSDGVHIFRDPGWDPETADLIAFSDACLTGLGFFFPSLLLGYQTHIPHGPPKDTIFFFEALAICSAIHYSASRVPLPNHLTIFSDNSNSVNMFNTLRAKPMYNTILKSSVDILILSNISLHVVYIPGEENVVADALSRYDNMRASAACPGLQIATFEPPRDALGRVQK
jgi:hypothetical protein